MNNSLCAVVFLVSASLSFGSAVAPATSNLMANGRIWAISHQIKKGENSPADQSSQVIELATGQNYFDGGKWKPSIARFEARDGGFLAGETQHKVQLKSNLNSRGSVKITTPDGQILNTTPVAIALYDAATGDSAVIGTITDCQGYLVKSNQVAYYNAFQGVCADIIYTIERGSFEQDVILTGRLDPSEWGFSPETTQIQVLTELYDAPHPEKIRSPLKVQKDPAIRQRMASPDLMDEVIAFGDLVFARGKAFESSNTGPNGSKFVPVAKEHRKIDGRTFLVESVEFSSISTMLESLPECEAAGLSRDSASRLKVRGYAAIPHPAINARRSSETSNVSAKLESTPHSELIAQAQLRAPHGVIIDYVTILGNLNDPIIFQGDTTYFVSGPVYCNGPVIIEGGAVFKYPNDSTAYIQINNDLTCSTASYRPAIFTAADDNSVGQILNATIWSGYTGMIAGSYANPAIKGAWGWDSDPQLHDLRFSYANEAVQVGFWHGNPIFKNLQLINCASGIRIVSGNGGLNGGSGMLVRVENCLFSQVGGFFEIDNNNYDEVRVFNCTFDNCTGSEYATIYNSIFANVSWGYFNVGGGWNNGSYNSSVSATFTSSTNPFCTVGAGRYYLLDDTFRNKGDTNIDSELLFDLRKKTTYPPVVYSNETIYADVALNPQSRGTGVPDLGYHYDPIDYIVSTYTVSNCNLTLSPGTVIGYYNDSASIWLKEGSSITSIGTPQKPNWFVRYNAVQESSTILGPNGALSGLPVNPYHLDLPSPSGTFRFTKFSFPSGGGYHIYHYGNWAFSNLLVQDCEFWNGQNYLGGTTNSHANVKNNLFRRSQVTAINYGSATNVALSFSNNLVQYVSFAWRGVGNSNLWSAYDNCFDNCTLGVINTPSDNGYNAYINCNKQLNPTNAHNIVLTNFNYVAGPLGDYYHGSTNLLNQGSATGGGAGLYHFTTQTNQVKEASSTVDIGYHYVALNADDQPFDIDEDGIPDYLEDANGNGVSDVGESSWVLNAYNGLSAGNGLKVFTPLK